MQFFGHFKPSEHLQEYIKSQAIHNPPWATMFFSVLNIAGFSASLGISLQESKHFLDPQLKPGILYYKVSYFLI